MVEKKTGISRELIIHPGETIADVLEERKITQAELAAQTGVTPAYISNVIAGKKDISANFALALEYALKVPKSFWLNLQANYDAELLELNESQTITDEERNAREELKDIVKFLRKQGKLSVGENKDESILSLRKLLQISNIANLRNIIPAGAFRMARATVNPYVLGAWIRMCELSEQSKNITSVFDLSKIEDLITEIKVIMLKKDIDIQKELMETFGHFGIGFSVVKNFLGAPVQGYISANSNGTYQIVLTIRGSYADIFWFSLFHELGHIVNGDLGKSNRYIDDGNDDSKEKKADMFASNALINSDSYQEFVMKRITIDSIISFAQEQNVMPYIVIGRLQKERRLDYKCFSRYKTRYKWVE